MTFRFGDDGDCSRIRGRIDLGLESRVGIDLEQKGLELGFGHGTHGWGPPVLTGLANNGAGEGGCKLIKVQRFLFRELKTFFGAFGGSGS